MTKFLNGLFLLVALSACQGLQDSTFRMTPYQGGYAVGGALGYREPEQTRYQSYGYGGYNQQPTGELPLDANPPERRLFKPSEIVPKAPGRICTQASSYVEQQSSTTGRVFSFQFGEDCRVTFQ